jgi:hypothetical protein
MASETPSLLIFRTENADHNSCMDTVARPPEVEEAIRRRAEKHYKDRGRIPGHETEDWLQAEAEILREMEIQRAPKPAFIVLRFEGTFYTGEYDTKHCDGYVPGEFRAGAPVEIRFAAEKMYVKRSNGKELETRVVKREVKA